jgi:hypothetical protein
VTQEMLTDEQRYMQLYDQYLDEGDADKRAELVLAMNDIERKYDEFSGF